MQIKKDTHPSHSEHLPRPSQREGEAVRGPRMGLLSFNDSLFHDEMAKYYIAIWVELYVGTHGSCVRSSGIVNENIWLLERTYGPCVPTCLLSTIHLIILLILKFNIQTSIFKVCKS